MMLRHASGSEDDFRRGAPGARRGGFTMVELLVVIAVIVLLVGLIVSVSVTVLARSEVRETQNIIRLLEMAMDEFHTERGTPVTYGNDGALNGDIYEIQEAASGVASVEEAVRITDQYWAIASRNSAVREMIARIEPRFVRRVVHEDDYDPDVDEDAIPVDYITRPSYRFVDAWDNPIVIVMSGREWVPGDGLRDEDGTIRTAFENRLGVAVNRRPYFVSAGPSDQFGNRSADPGSTAYDQARDNVYSYEVIQP